MKRLAVSPNGRVGLPEYRQSPCLDAQPMSVGDTRHATRSVGDPTERRIGRNIAHVPRQTSPRSRGPLALEFRHVGRIGACKLLDGARTGTGSCRSGLTIIQATMRGGGEWPIQAFRPPNRYLAASYRATFPCHPNRTSNPISDRQDRARPIRSAITKSMSRKAPVRSRTIFQVGRPIPESGSKIP